VAVRDRLDRLPVHVVDDYRHSRVADICSGGLQLFASKCSVCYLLAIFVLCYDVFDAPVGFCSPQKFLSTIKPARNWGPVDPIYRHCWVQWKKQYQVTGERDFTLRRRGTKDYTHSIKRGKHAAPPGTAYSVSPTSLDRTSSCYSIDGVGGLSRQHSSDQQSQHQQQQQQKNLHQYNYNHTMADQRRWTTAEPKNNGGSSINYM